VSEVYEFTGNRRIDHLFFDFVLVDEVFAQGVGDMASEFW
jgi:hypothetical protein